LNDIGLIYYNQHESLKALIYYERSLKIEEETDDQPGIGSALNNIGLIYERLGQFPKALEYFNKSLKIREELSLKLGVAMSLNSIGAVLFKMASGTDKQQKYAQASVYVNRSLALSKELGFPKNIRNAEYVLSKIDSAQGNYSGAFEHFKQYII